MTHGIRYSTSRYFTGSGFTLIELMIVIAVASTLFSIAVPSYNRFVRKARQAEAKSNLAAIYTGESTFRSEWGGYTGDLRDIGVMLSGRLNYDVGFAGAGFLPPPNFVPTSSPFCGSRMAYNTEVSACALAPGSSQAKVIFRTATASPNCGPGLIPTATEFRATAIGLLDGTREDIWTIDHKRSLCNNQSGL
ncbi:MAG: type IV pilin protein [Bdellovibrionales bacterium]